MHKLQPQKSIVDLIVWSRLSGITWWNKIGLNNGSRGRGLFATQSVQKNDIVLSVPLRSTFSFLNFELERTFPLKVTPQDYGLGLSWWPDLDWGTFTLIAWLTSKSLVENPNTQPYIAALPRFSDNSESASEKPLEQFAVLRSIARQSMRSREYVEITEQLVSQSVSNRRHFDSEFEWLYTMVRSRSIPVWTQQGGHEAFRSTLYGKESAHSGDVCCLVPMLDMVNHSLNNPNVSIGFPGEEVTDYIMENAPSRRKNVEVSESFCLPNVSEKAFILLTAKSDIQAGDEILMDYNQFYGFDSDIFSAWFNTPLKDEVKTPFSRNGEMSYRMK